MKKIFVLAIASMFTITTFTSCEEKSKEEKLKQEMKEDGAEMKVKNDGDETKIKMETEEKTVKIKKEEGEETEIKVDDNK